MNPASVFFREFAGAVAAALLPVVLVAFWSIPYNLHGNPGDARPATAQSAWHMT
jgi:hypothetical protein